MLTDSQQLMNVYLLNKDQQGDNQGAGRVVWQRGAAEEGISLLVRA